MYETWKMVSVHDPVLYSHFFFFFLSQLLNVEARCIAKGIAYL